MTAIGGHLPEISKHSKTNISNQNVKGGSRKKAQPPQPFLEVISNHHKKMNMSKKIPQDNGNAIEVSKTRSKKAFEHRHYFSLHPTCNNILAKRWEEKTMQMHKDKLKQAKPNIDNAQPKMYPHLEMRLKGVQIEEERLHEIERRNHILLNRISFQMLNPSEVSNLHIYSEEETLTLLKDAGDHKRKRIKQKISHENHVILQRIEDKPPNYNRVAWFYDRKRNLEHLANIARYPTPFIETLEEYEEIMPRQMTPSLPTRLKSADGGMNAQLVQEFSRESKAGVEVEKRMIERRHSASRNENLKALEVTEPEEPLVSIPSNQPHSRNSISFVVHPNPEPVEISSENLDTQIVSENEETVHASPEPELSIQSKIVSNIPSRSQSKSSIKLEDLSASQVPEKTPSKISSAQDKTESKSNVSNTQGSQSKYIKGSIKSLAKAASETQVEKIKSPEESKPNLSEYPITLSVKGSLKSLAKAASDSR
ncbi:hypothetical protein HK100_009902, partial [Physocladia obscura]